MGRYLDLANSIGQPGSRSNEKNERYEKSPPRSFGEDDQAEDLREHFEERAGILEHDAGLPRPEAELEAARITATLARNRGYPWASLRAAMADYPILLAQVPDKAGPVDALPLGTAKLAVLNDKRVVRQGTFSGAQEVAEARGSDA